MMKNQTLSEKVEKVIDLKKQYRKAASAIQDEIDAIIPAGYIRVNFGGITSVSVSIEGESLPFNFYSNDWCEDTIRTWVNKAGFVMDEQDYPVSQAQGERFCKFFELNPLEKAYIMNKCATNEQYDEYINYERRNSDY